jgi:hypothetical protein
LIIKAYNLVRAAYKRNSIKEVNLKHYMSDRRKNHLRVEAEKRSRMKDSDYQKQFDRTWGQLDYEKEWKRTNWEDAYNEWEEDDDYQYHKR